MANRHGAVHHAYMAIGRRKHFLRAWREFKGRSLEAVAEAVVLLSQERATESDDLRPLTMTHATLSRIERGKLPYNQHLLELLADIYGTDEASLLIRDPSKPEAPYSLLDGLTPRQLEQAVEMIKVIKRTGTDA